MSSGSRGTSWVLGFIALVSSTTAHAADPPTVEERLRELESANASLAQQLQKLQQQQVSLPPAPPPPAAEPASTEPFAWGDFTWLNGASRADHQASSTPSTSRRSSTSTRTTPTRSTTPSTTPSSARRRPRATTSSSSRSSASAVTSTSATCAAGSSSSTARARPRCRATISRVNRGQFDLLTVYRYLSEAYAGYHFNKLHGINLDVGLFFSYVGLFSYTQFENWGYQASFTSDNTPWFFNGARLQIFPTDRLKVELWLINGWQTYGKFNELPGVGYQIRYAPREWMKLRVQRLRRHRHAGPSRARPLPQRQQPPRSLLQPSAARTGSAAAPSRSPSISASSRATASRRSRGSGTRGQLHQRHAVRAGLRQRHGLQQALVLEEPSRLDGRRRLHPQPRPLSGAGAHGVAASTFDTNPGTKFDGWDLSTNVSAGIPTENITFRLEVSFTTNRAFPTTPAAAASPGPTATSAAGSTTPTARSPPARRRAGRRTWSNKRRSSSSRCYSASERATQRSPYGYEPVLRHPPGSDALRRLQTGSRRTLQPAALQRRMQRRHPLRLPDQLRRGVLLPRGSQQQRQLPTLPGRRRSDRLRDRRRKGRTATARRDEGAGGASVPAALHSAACSARPLCNLQPASAQLLDHWPSSAGMVPA